MQAATTLDVLKQGRGPSVKIDIPQRFTTSRRFFRLTQRLGKFLIEQVVLVSLRID